MQCFAGVEQSMLGTIGTEIRGMNSPLVKSVLDRIKRSGIRSSLWFELSARVSERP